MLEFIRWYLDKFGSKDFIGLWLAWIGFVTLCAIEARQAFISEGPYEPSTVFTTILGGVVGYVVGSRSRRPEE